MIVSFIQKGNTSTKFFWIRVPTYLVLVIKLNKKGGCCWPQQLAIHLEEPVISAAFWIFKTSKTENFPES